MIFINFEMKNANNTVTCIIVEKYEFLEIRLEN